jgi:flavin-dependent thymidylate synthase
VCGLRADHEAMSDRSNSVELQGTYGGDVTHALSAWTSTKRELTPEREKRIGALLHKLATSDPPHTTPFEKSAIHYVCKVETATHIQMVKHRIAVSFNGESARYKEHNQDKWYVPEDWPQYLHVHLDDHCQKAFERYHFAMTQLEPLVGRKRAKESARFFLPYASQIWCDVMFNFHSFMHFQKLRNDIQAQDEIHGIADEMLRLLVGSTNGFDLSLRAYGWEPEDYRG